MGQGCRYQNYLSKRWEVSVDIVDLIFESSVQHFVSFIQDKQSDGSCPEISATDHIEHSSGGTGDYMLPRFQFSQVFKHIVTPEGMALNVHTITQGGYNFLDLECRLASGTQYQDLCLLDHGVQGLQDADGESRSFFGSRW